MRFRRFVSVGLLVSVVFFFHSCFQFRTTDKKQWEELSVLNTNYFIDIGEKQVDSNRIHYTLVVSDSTFPLAVFIHGSPGSSSNFLQYAKDTSLLKEYNVLLLDRPGFGYSDFGKPVSSIARQADILNDVIGQFNFKDIVLVGHSLGGPIICKMAIDTPNAYSGLFIVAGSVSPELEPEEKWRYALDKKWIRWLLPNTLDVSNQEILPAKQELIAMESLWKQITCKVVIMQGGEDDLVPPDNADYAEKMLINAKSIKVLRLPNENHFIPFTKPELLTEVLLGF